MITGRLTAAAVAALLLTGCQLGSARPPKVAGLDVAAVQAATQPPTASGPLDGLRIVVDPGHAGTWDKETSGKVSETFGGVKVPCYTAGATAPDGTTEHALNFDLAKRTAAALRALGATTVYTRTDDASFGPCNDDRGKLANTAGADALVALHGDSDAASKRGFHVIYATQMRGGARVAAASKAMAQDVADALRGSGLPPANYKGTPDSPIDPRTNIAALNELATAPGVLVEIGNLNSPDDWATIARPETRDALAEAVARGVQASLDR